MSEYKLRPIIKWPGGKERELSIILGNMPKQVANYYEPFVGGGSVFMASNAKKFFINDKSAELINFYNNISDGNEDFFKWAQMICASWKNMQSFAQKNQQLVRFYYEYSNNKKTDDDVVIYLNNFVLQQEKRILAIIPDDFEWHREVLVNECRKNLERKIFRMKKIECEKGILSQDDVYLNIETALLSSLYMYFRFLYNDAKINATTPLSAALFFFIRNYAYSSMFRYNKDGDFNVPYGGMGYNSKNLITKLSFYQEEEVLKKFKNTKIFNLDFLDFFQETVPQENDFIFLDPPYDTDFSTYDRNVFAQADQKRLADYLCTKSKAQWMLIIKNTPFILSLYNGKGFNIRTFDKTYSVSFMNRNNRKTKHLLITNY